MYWTFLNQSANQVITFIVGIIMARLLSPEDYGITALPAVFLAVAGIFMNAGFGQALVRKPEVTEKDLSTAFYYSIAMGVVMYVILFFSAPLIADFYSTPVLTPLIRITSLTFLWGPLNTPQSVILQRKLDFKTPARISVATNILGAIVGIIAAYNGLGLWALVITGVVSSILNLLQTWWAVKWVPTTRWCKDSFSYLWGYGNKMIGANLVDAICSNVAPVIIGKSLSPTTLGIYNRADGYAKLPANQLNGLLMGVSFPVLSRIQDDNASLQRHYRNMIRTSAFVSFPIFFLLAILAEPLIISMIGSKWEECVIILQILCFERMFWPIQSLNKNLLQVKGRSDLFLKIELIKKITIIFLYVISLRFGIIVFCCSQIVGCIFSLFINTYYTGKILDLGLNKQIADILPSFILSIIMGMCVLLSIHIIQNYLLQIVVGGVVGVSIYCIFAKIAKFQEFDQLLFLLNIKKN